MTQEKEDEKKEKRKAPQEKEDEKKMTQEKRNSRVEEN